MRIARVIAVCGLVGLIGSARAESPVPSNYVDDFGSLVPSHPTAASPARPAAHVSLIMSNYVDDFGPLAPAAPAPAETTAGADDAHQLAVRHVWRAAP